MSDRPKQRTTDRGLNGPPSSQAYKQEVARLAEKATRSKLYNEGYDSVRRMQHNKVHGIDLAAVKYDPAGRVKKACVVEVKGSADRKLSPARFKEQVTQQYVEKNLRRAEAAGVRGADTLHQMAKQKALGIMGSTYRVNDRKGAQLHQIYEPPKTTAAPPVGAPSRGSRK
ncbi:MAG TPA: hypothetical protein VF546_05895 [Pyrinomonadaceae bacterium]|jgi:Holliday junction resolvase-like predicted endonuclease